MFIRFIPATTTCWHDFTAVLLSLHQGTASEATLISLLAARCRMVKRMQASNPQMSEYEIVSKLVSYTSKYVSTQTSVLPLPMVYLKIVLFFQFRYKLWIKLVALLNHSRFDCYSLRQRASEVAQRASEVAARCDLV